MRNRLLLIAAPLCIVLLLAGVAAASPIGGEHFKDEKLDDPHVVRPIAASTGTDGPFGLDVIYMNLVTGARVALTPPTPPAPEPEPAPTALASTGGGDFLSCIRARESGGNYTVHNTGGSGASGAYQFMPGTWNSIAASSGRPDLVGVDPAAASPSDQDAMAGALYAEQGSSPWGGHCG